MTTNKARALAGLAAVAAGGFLSAPSLALPITPDLRVEASLGFSADCGGDGFGDCTDPDNFEALNTSINGRYGLLGGPATDIVDRAVIGDRVVSGTLDETGEGLFGTLGVFTSATGDYSFFASSLDAALTVSNLSTGTAYWLSFAYSIENAASVFFDSWINASSVSVGADGLGLDALSAFEDVNNVPTGTGNFNSRVYDRDTGQFFVVDSTVLQDSVAGGFAVRLAPGQSLTLNAGGEAFADVAQDLASISQSFELTLEAVRVPAPDTLALWCAGLLGAGLFGRGTGRTV